MALISCPECGRDVSSAAASCPQCGHPITRQVVTAEPQAKWNPGIAAVLSLVIPGAGQMYKGQVGIGLVWLVAVFIGYVLVLIPGLILHLICIINAASGDPKK